MRKMKCGKWLAYLVSMALLTGVCGGCGKTEGEENRTAGAENNGAGSGKGCYVEKEEILPEELQDWTVNQMFEAEGKLRFLTSKQEEEKTILREWEKQEEGLVDVSQNWLSSLELPDSEWMELKLVQGTGGSQYLYAGYLTGEEEEFQGHLWKGEGQTAQEITPEKWSVKDELFGGYEMIQGLAALDNGTLVTHSYTSIDILNGEDGSVIESEPMTLFYEGSVVTDGENIYLNAGSQIEKRQEGKGTNAVMISFPDNGAAGNTESGGSIVVSMGSASSLLLGVQKDGSLMAAGEDGIFRMTGTETDPQWEKLAEGVDTDFSMKEYWCKDMAVMEDGSLYALFNVDGGLKLNHYEYDPNGVPEVTQELKLYTVYESSMLKQAASMYHKAHPEVLITIESEYPAYYFDTPNYDDVYKKLNTMLMGDQAPDILVLDQLDVESYEKKGLLVDLNDVVGPMEENGDLMDNITGAYVGEDGSRYAVPLQFAFPMVLGRDIPVEDMCSMEALAKFLAQEDYSYMGTQTVTELVDKFYPFFCADIVHEKQLNKEVLGKYLEYMKAIGENCGIIDSRPETERSYDIWNLGGLAKLAIEKEGGFLGCMLPMSMVDYIKGDYGIFENMFYPSVEVGICAKSQYLETAKDFLRFALSDQVQDQDYFEAFPVNRKSLEKQAVKDRSDFVSSTVITADDGGITSFESKPYSQEVANKLVALCGTLEKPIKEDAKIREVLIECLGGYLEGTQSADETIEKIEAGLKMYLAE